MMTAVMPVADTGISKLPDLSEGASALFPSGELARIFHNDCRKTVPSPKGWRELSIPRSVRGDPYLSRCRLTLINGRRAQDMS